MSIVQPTTGELVEMSVFDAQDLTRRIKDGLERDWLLIKRAYEKRAWASLGYATWDAYCAKEFGDGMLRLPRETRQEAVVSLRDAGLSIRAIAAATGASRGTVANDLDDAGVQNWTPAADDEVVDAEIVDPAPITGTDGKSYPSQASSAPRRSPLPEMAARAGWEFRKSVERLERLADDDRFTANKKQVADHWAGHLSYAIEVCQDLIDQLKEISE